MPPKMIDPDYPVFGLDDGRLFFSSGEEVRIGQVESLAGDCAEYDGVIPLEALSMSFTLSGRSSKQLRKILHQAANCSRRAIRRQKRRKEKERRKRLKNGGTTHGKTEARQPGI